jgi:hypothetical protein
LNPKRIELIMAIFLTGLIVLSGCSQGKDPSAAAAEEYLKALVGKDADQLSSLSCSAWEADALLELDSFQAVEASLEGMDCQKSGEEEGQVQVQCQGKIVATYNQEMTEIDLSRRVYQVVEEGGELRVCGYQ